MRELVVLDLEWSESEADSGSHGDEESVLLFRSRGFTDHVSLELIPAD